MPPSQQNPYDFILSPAQKPRRSFSLGGSPKARFALIAVCIIILIVLFMAISSFLSQSSNAQKDRLIEIAQAQNEIIRVSALSENKAKNLNTTNYALNTKLSVTSSQAEIKTALSKYGIKDKGLSKALAASRNAKTDAALQEATQNNRFDETFTAILDKQLSDYQKLLETAHSSSTRKTEKQALKDSSNNVSQLKPQTAAATSPQ